MNEHIKDIANQCFHAYSEHQIDLEKFAKLIAQECADIAGETPCFMVEDNQYIADKIRDAFGLE